ncbi:lipopolysaccharide biosynthesis protein [Dyella sp. C9]|uniref:lipopolysaccharide biosynthesis protein n=1 Tax=Dyella sp. C9 TaxID=2202154 RepID=UPI000DEEF4A3|nr:lipopolysaccharide biosynthesis protein [Dyella sp. C9]
MKGRLARASLKTAIMLGLRVATQAGTLILLTRLLGPSRYGNYAAAASLAIVLGTLPNLGSGYIMLSRVSRGPSAIAGVWRYAWPLTVLLGLALLVAFVFASSCLVTDPTLTLPLLAGLGVTELLLTPLTMLFSFALQALERVPLSQVVQWLPLGLRVVVCGACFALPDKLRLPAFIALQLAASLVGLVGGWLITRRHIQLDWRPRRATRQELKDGASYAAMLLVAFNPSELDKMIAVRGVGAQQAGIYIACSRIMNALVMPVVAMLMAAQPRLFRLRDEVSHQHYRLVWTIAIIALGWGVVCGLALALLSPYLTWVLGPTFAGSAELLRWLAVTPVLISMRNAAGCVLAALGRPLERLGFELGGVLILAASMLVLTPRFGVYGLVASVIVAEICMTVAGWALVRRLMRRYKAGLEQTPPDSSRAI